MTQGRLDIYLVVRAGVYLVGNSSTLTQKSAHWKTLVSYFESQNAISCSIPLRCPRHPNHPPIALSSTTASKFETSHVCRRGCEALLPCGHSCVRPCHSGIHSSPCKQLVRFNFRLCGHSQEKQCHEDEKELTCVTKVMHKFDNCLHNTLLVCWQVKGSKKVPDLACKKDCEKKRECRHMCTLLCSESCEATPCKSCIEIEKENERIKKQLQAKAREEVKKLEMQIKALGATVNAEFSLQVVHPLGDSAEDYLLAKGKVEKSFPPEVETVPVVTKIEKIKNLRLERMFLEAQKDLFSPQENQNLWLFYGASTDQLHDVVQNGFKDPQQQDYGFDVYSSVTARASQGELLLCEVQLGKNCRILALENWDFEHRPVEVRDMFKASPRPPGCDSMSFLVLRESPGKCTNEAYVHFIYNPDLAIPRFLVSYKLEARATPQEMENFGETQARESKEKFCRIPLTPASSVQENDPGDNHFRRAESQFFRMSTNRKLKVTLVEYIVNLGLKEKYLERKENFKRRNVPHEETFVFHGTESGAIDKIARGGFKIGGTEGVAIRSGAKYGNGVYTAVNPDISVAYSRGSKMMLLSRCIKGSYQLHHTHGESEDVLVIKNVSQLLPRYVVHYS